MRCTHTSKGISLVSRVSHSSVCLSFLGSIVKERELFLGPYVMCAPWLKVLILKRCLFFLQPCSFSSSPYRNFPKAYWRDWAWNRPKSATSLFTYMPAYSLCLMEIKMTWTRKSTWFANRLSSLYAHYSDWNWSFPSRKKNEPRWWWPVLFCG